MTPCAFNLELHSCQCNGHIPFDSKRPKECNAVESRVPRHDVIENALCAFCGRLTSSVCDRQSKASVCHHFTPMTKYQCGKCRIIYYWGVTNQTCPQCNTTDNQFPYADPNKKETVNHPNHYGGKDNPFEVIKVLEAWLTPEQFDGFLIGNAIKYEARFRHKGGIEDIRKATWYLNHYLQKRGGEK